MAKIEKVALSLEFWGSKWLLLEGPGGPSDCIFTVFFARLLRGQEIVGTLTWPVIVPGFGPHTSRAETRILEALNPSLIEDTWTLGLKASRLVSRYLDTGPEG